MSAFEGVCVGKCNDYRYLLATIDGVDFAQTGLVNIF